MLLISQEITNYSPTVSANSAAACRGVRFCASSRSTARFASRIASTLIAPYSAAGARRSRLHPRRCGGGGEEHQHRIIARQRAFGVFEHHQLVGRDPPRRTYRR